MKKFDFEVLKEFSYSQLFLLRKKMNYVLNTSDLVMALNPTSYEEQERRIIYEANSRNIDKALKIAIEKTKEPIMTKNERIKISLTCLALVMAIRCAANHFSISASSVLLRSSVPLRLLVTMPLAMPM